MMIYNDLGNVGAFNLILLRKRARDAQIALTFTKNIYF